MDRIAKELARIVRHPLVGSLRVNEVPALPALEEEWIRLFRLLRGATGVDFGFYKPSTVKRLLARRMAIAKAQSLAFLCAETRAVTSPRIHSVVQGAKSPEAEFQRVLGEVAG